MKISLSRVIVFSAIIAAAIATYDLSFNTFTALNPTITTIQTTQYGWRVTQTRSGWVYGAPIQVSSGVNVVAYATLLQSSGQTGIGLIATNCADPYTAANHPEYSFANDISGANEGCPADFATVYTTRPTPTSSSANLIPDVLTQGDPVAWTLTQPATTSGNVIGISVESWSNTPGTAQGVSTAGAAGTTGGAQQYALASYEYTLYLETLGSAIVCFQTGSQFATSPGECGEVYSVVGHSTDSAGIVSTAACIFITLFALIFFN